jgi:hypothetical protein
MVEGKKELYNWWEKTSINQPQALAIKTINNCHVVVA